MLGQFSIGYRTQEYHDPLPDINTPVLLASLLWNITDLTTTSINIDRSIQETIDPVFSGYISTTSSLKLDHELRRNLLLNLSLMYGPQDYKGIPPAERTDTTYDVSAGSTYKMNRNFYFTIQYHYLQRESESITPMVASSRFDFVKNLIFFRITAQI